MRIGGNSRAAGYELLMQLAAGGMATVHLGLRCGAAGFDRLVVIKQIHRHLLDEEGLRAMFADEARLTSHVHHANVVPVVDVIDTEGADGELALVMDYVESVSLAELLRVTRARGERLPVAIVSRIMGDALLGLHAAHEAKDADGKPLAIVHRDVSPQNIIVGVDGVARLIDFGIAKAAERAAVTREDVLKGKVRYMSPEQARRRPLDRRSDIYSAGLVLYEALAGRPAVRGVDEADVWIELLGGEIEPFPGLVPELQAVLSYALSPDLEARAPTAVELERRLRDAAPPASAEAVGHCVDLHVGEKIEARRSAIRKARRDLAAAEPTSPPASARPAGEPTEHPSRARRPRVVLPAALLLLAVIAVAVVIGRTRTGGAPVDDRPERDAASARTK